MTISTTKMTAEQYRQMGKDPPGVRLELVDGEIAVSPSPSPGHSITIMELVFLLKTHVDALHLGALLMDCDTIFGEYDVRRPDILFFAEARRDLIGEKKLKGKPDLAVEVVSESSDRIDREDKFTQYAGGGVKFYWIVDPLARSFEAYILKSGSYAPAASGAGNDVVSAEPFKGLEIPLGKLWWPGGTGGTGGPPKSRRK